MKPGWRLFERLESAALLVLSLSAYFYFLDGSGLLLLVLALAPDISMAGYLFLDSEKAALVYNAFHNYSLPALLLGYYLLTANPLAGQVALIWIGHIAADRLLG